MEKFLDRVLKKKEIYRRPDELYLTRYYVMKTKWFAIYIHKFHVSDFNIHHDHPFNFVAIPLIGGYREHFMDGTSVWRGAFSPKFRTAQEFHWVELEKGPAWTLFIRGRKFREWGFLVPEKGWVHYETHNKSLGIE